MNERLALTPEPSLLKRIEDVAEIMKDVPAWKKGSPVNERPAPCTKG